jgi:hypothetical protein
MPEIGTWLDALNAIPKNLPQRQDSTADQLCDLILFANRLGFYDAEDYIKHVVKGDN